MQQYQKIFSFKNDSMIKTKKMNKNYTILKRLAGMSINTESRRVQHNVLNEYLKYFLLILIVEYEFLLQIEERYEKWHHVLQKIKINNNYVIKNDFAGK